jgi:SAM-dependent methyltransferase
MTATRHASFLPGFDATFAPRLQHRARTFRAVFERLEARARPPLIVETGCARAEGPFAWAGDGQSTVLFDHFAGAHDGAVVSVDKDPAACTLAARLVSERTQVVCGDSVEFLWRFRPERPIDLLYLDSFDLDWNDPHPSSLHHLKELCAALPRLEPGCLVVVDDNQGARGKGQYVRQFMTEIGAALLFDEYQIGWELPAATPLGLTPTRDDLLTEES